MRYFTYLLYYLNLINLVLYSCVKVDEIFLVYPRQGETYLEYTDRMNNISKLFIYPYIFKYG